QGPGRVGPPPASRPRDGVISVERRSLPPHGGDAPRGRTRGALRTVRRDFHGRVRRPSRAGHETPRGDPSRPPFSPGPLRELPPGPLSRRPALPVEGLLGGGRRLRRVPR